MLLLRKGELGAAVEAARKSLEVDAKFLRSGNLRFGDALLCRAIHFGAQSLLAVFVVSRPERAPRSSAAAVAKSVVC